MESANVRRIKPAPRSKAHERIQQIRDRVNYASRFLRASDILDNVVNLNYEQREKVTIFVGDMLKNL